MNKTIKIPYNISLPNYSDSDGNTVFFSDTIDYTPEPFETRESLTSTLRAKVLSHLMHRASVTFDEKALDKALVACDTMVVEAEREAREDYLACLESERLNVTNDDEPDWTDDEVDRWLAEHYRLRDTYSTDSTEYDTEALIKTVLLYANEGSY